MTAMRTRVSLLMLALALSAAQAASASAPADDLLLPKDKRPNAPKLALRDLDDQKQQLTNLKGKVVVVNFWATWCGPCKAEMPEFTRVHAEYRDRGVEFVGAANERRGDREKVREFVTKLDIKFPIWLEMSLDHMDAFKVGPGLPATVVVDQQGRVAARIKGVTHAGQLRELIDRLVAEGSASMTSAGTR